MIFSSLDLVPDLQKGIDACGYKEMTPIQEQAIIPARRGKDLLAIAQTGTGKTAAYAIPVLQQLMTDPNASEEIISPRALVLTPTRELAQQVLKQVEDFTSRKARINTALLIGGDPYGKQLSQLRQNPRIICGTPGRINDHLERGTLDLSEACFLVLDETDRMLDMGFSVQIERILKSMPEERQTLLFSATLPKNIVQLSSKYMSDPIRVSVATDNKIAENLYVAGLASGAKTMFAIANGEGAKVACEIFKLWTGKPAVAHDTIKDKRI